MKKRFFIILPVLVAALCVGVALLNRAVSLKNEYDAACALMDANDYNAAADAFALLGDYLDSKALLAKCNRLMKAQSTESEEERLYRIAQNYYLNGEYKDARKIFRSLGSYSDAEERISDCTYELGEFEMLRGNYETAAGIFASLVDYKDSAALAMECRYLQGLEYIKNGHTQDAVALFKRMGPYKDTESYIAEYDKGLVYDEAVRLLKNNDTHGALKLFYSIEDYKDSKSRASDIAGKIYTNVTNVHLKNEDYRSALSDLAILAEYGYSDSAEKRAELQETLYEKAENAALNTKTFDTAIEYYGILEDYKDSRERLTEARYNKVVYLSDIETDKYEAYLILLELGDYKDTSLRLAEIQQLEDRYIKAIAHIENKEYEEAFDLLKNIDYRDGKVKFWDVAEVLARASYEKCDYLAAYNYLAADYLPKSCRALFDDIMYELCKQYFECGMVEEAVSALNDNRNGIKCEILLKEIKNSPEYWRLETSTRVLLGKMRTSAFSEEIDYISWSVFKRERDRIWIISDEIISCEPYGGESWQESFLRKWLNVSFLDSVFSDEEKRYIADMERDGVTDKVSLISAEELMTHQILSAGANTYVQGLFMANGLPESWKWSFNWYLLDGSLYHTGKDAYFAWSTDYVAGVRPIVCLTFE